MTNVPVAFVTKGVPRYLGAPELEIHAIRVRLLLFWVVGLLVRLLPLRPGGLDSIGVGNMSE
jgi:hypothetical protein